MKWVTAEEAAQKLGLSLSGVRHLGRRKLVRTKRVTRRGRAQQLLSSSDVLRLRDERAARAKRALKAEELARTTALSASEIARLTDVRVERVRVFRCEAMGRRPQARRRWTALIE